MRIALLIALAVPAWLSTAASASDQPAPTQGRTLASESKTVELRGCHVRAVKTARLATDRPGVLAAVDPKEGDTVHERQVVARLMDEVPKASLEVAKLVADDPIEIEYARKLNEVDTAEYEKDIAANRQHLNTVPDLEVRRARLAMERSHLQIGKAKHETDVNVLKAKQAEAELETYRIVAPFDGVVTQVVKHRGEAVHQGDPILEVVNTDVVRVEGQVNEKDIWSVKVGSPVTVRLSIEGADLDVRKQVFHGRIGFVDVVASLASHDTRVWAEIANPNNALRPGFLATMTILPLPPDAVGLKTSMVSPPASRAPRRSPP